MESHFGEKIFQKEFWVKIGLFWAFGYPGPPKIWKNFSWKYSSMFVGSVSKSKKVGFRHLHGDKTAQNYFVA